MLDTTIQVLAIDDELDISILTKNYLERSRVMLVDAVPSVSEARAKLAKKRYDVIVCDYQMPEVNGIQFLKSLRQAGDETPFILFTGKGREEVVIEAFNCGADSYVQKGGMPVPQYAELEQRINVAVQRHRGKDALLDSERRFKDFFEATQSGVAIYYVLNKGESGADYIVRDFNRRALEMECKSKEEVIGRSLLELRPNIDTFGLIPIFCQVWQTGESAFFPSKAYVDDHYANWYENTVFRLPNGEIVAIYNDVTERKSVEDALKESEARFEQLAVHQGTVIWETDANGLYTYASEMSESIWGYRPDELVGKKYFYDLTPEAERESLKALALGVFKSKGKFRGLESHIQTKDGRIIWVSTSGLPLLNPDGTLRGYQGSDIDITVRKQSEKATLASKKMMADIIDFLPDATFVVDMGGRITSWNQAIEKMSGVMKEDMIGQGDHAYSVPFYGTRRNQLIDLLTLDDEEIKKNYDYVTRKGDTLYAETFCSALNGGKGAYVWAVARSIFDENGDRLGAIESIRDITERKRVEKALQESVQRYELVMDGSSAGLWDSDIINNRIHFSPHWKEMRGYADNEIGDDRMEWISRIHPEDAPRIVAALQTHFEGGTDIYEAEYRVRRKDGSYIWVLDRGKAVRDSNGRVIRNVGSEIDITERKRAEEALSASQRIIEGIINTIPVRVFWKDLNLVYLGCNTVFARDAGFADSKDVIGKDDLQMVWRDQAELYRSDDRQVIESGIPKLSIEEPQTTPSGEIITLLTSKTPLRGPEGEIIGVLGTYIDITERRRAEDALRESEAKIRAYFDNSPEGIFIVGEKGNYLDVNSAACSMLGYSREELLAMNIAELSEESARQDALKGFEKLVTERAMTMETILLKKDGVGVPIFLNAVGLPGDRYMAFCTDISERRRAEAALKESVQRYELVMEGSSAGLWDWDVRNHRIHFSSRWKAMRGYADTEIGEGEMEWSSRLHPEDELRVMAALQAHFDGLTDFYEEEYRIVCKDGSIKWILDRGKAVRDAAGHVTRAAGSEIDITERKKMDLQINEQIKQLGAFYSLAEMAERDGLTLKDLYQEIANVLPNSWRYSETAYARVVINNSEFRTENFKESPWKQISPVRFNGSVIGKIEVGYLEKRPEEDEGPFLRDERQLLEAIAERIGHITGRRWVEEELHRSNAKLGILNNITRHDINNQMMVINGFLELCRKREKDPDLAHYIDKMSLAAANVHEQINFTKDYQELGIKAPAWSSVGRRVKDAFAMLHPQGVVLEDRTEGIEVLTDPLADKVHYNLIDNSMRHGGKITRIKVYSEQSGDAMKIIYEDDGVGISQEDKKRLFQKGFGKNTGYGLFLIREILAITGITINETGHPGRGVRFEMLVPPGAWRRAPG